MKIAISGATGQVGSKIVRKLMNQSDRELVLLSKRGIGLQELQGKRATVYTGDIKEPAFLQQSLAGVDTFYLMFPPQNNVEDVIGHYQIILDNAIAAIKQHRIPRVVLQSSYGAHLESGTGPIVGTYLAEQALNATDADFTAIRPCYFMENFLWFVNSIRDNGAIYLPVSGKASTCFIATQDIADAATAIILDNQWQGNQVKELCTDCDLTFDMVAQIIGNELNTEIQHVELTNEEAIKSLTSPEVGFSQDYAKAFIEIHRAIESKYLKFEFANSQKITQAMPFDVFVKKYLKSPLGNV